MRVQDVIPLLLIVKIVTVTSLTNLFLRYELVTVFYGFIIDNCQLSQV